MRTLLVSFAAVVLASCGARTPLDTGDEASGGGRAVGEGGSTAAGGGGSAGRSGVTSATGGASANGACPSHPGPPLEPITTLGNGDPLECIDATEVTNEDYAAFLASAPSASSQPAVCTGNASFVPLFGWPKSGSDLALPVVNVDWCDARAYCAWAGKHLCGSTSPPANTSDPFVAKEWMRACGGTNASAYPYGDFYDPTLCNGLDAHRGMPVIELGGPCEGATSGVYDMSGNVWEWQDDCDGDEPGAMCTVRGGSFRSDEDSLRCDAIAKATRASAYDDFGIRCCL